MKTLLSPIVVPLALAWILTICAVGMFAALVGWRWLDDKCARALEG